MHLISADLVLKLKMTLTMQRVFDHGAVIVMLMVLKFEAKEQRPLADQANL
jgi:hypothetical protein